MPCLKHKYLSVLFCSLLLIPLSGFAQNNIDYDIDLRDEMILKVSGLTPAAGVSFKVGDKSKLRALGFITVYSSNRLGHRNDFFLDLSYLRYNNWIENESFKSYWGVDLNMLFQDPVIAPGVLVGTSYNLTEQFAIFGEVGLNVYIQGEGADTLVGLYNTGVGIKVAL
jgi:hypothetical protein